MSRLMDCGDSSCMFAVKKGGMRTNGGCRCLDDTMKHVSDCSGWVYPRIAMSKVYGHIAEMKVIIKDLEDKLDEHVEQAG